MRITEKLTISMSTGEVLEHVFYEYQGPVELACGATQQQQNVGNEQNTLFQNMVNQGTQIFGASSAIFNDLVSAFSPVVSAGPGQQGFSAGEESNLNSAAITNTATAYRNADQAVKENESAVGGGNTALPGGAQIGADTAVATAGAQQESSELNQINEANYAQGRANFFQAASDLAEAPNVFSPATSAESAATNSGAAASNTQNQIAQENDSWVQSVTGALGGIAGAAVQGGMKNLGEGAGFFGQNAVPQSSYPS